MTGKAYVDQWASHLRGTLCQVHQNNPGRISYEYAMGGLEECAKFIADYHGRDTAVGVLDRLTNSTLAGMKLAPGVVIPPPPSPPPPSVEPTTISIGIKRFSFTTTKDRLRGFAVGWMAMGLFSFLLHFL